MENVFAGDSSGGPASNRAGHHRIIGRSQRSSELQKVATEDYALSDYFRLGEVLDLGSTVQKIMEPLKIPLQTPYLEPFD